MQFHSLSLCMSEEKSTLAKSEGSSPSPIEDTKGVYDDYQHLHGFFPAHKGRECFWQAWIADPSFQRNLVIHHGLGEHSGCYGNILGAFSLEKINVFSYDVRGHGNSKGERGLIKDVHELVFDLDCYLTMLEKEFHVKEPILYGHSLGGLTALSFALRHSNQWQLKALVVNGASLRPLLSWSDQLIRILTKWLNNIFPSIISKLVITRAPLIPDLGRNNDLTSIQSKSNDPLVHDKISVSLGLSIMSVGAEVLEKAHLLYLPLLITHGGEDLVVNCSGSIQLQQSISTEDKKLIIYPALHHEIHNELPEKRAKVLQDLKQWVLQHI